VYQQVSFHDFIYGIKGISKTMKRTKISTVHGSLFQMLTIGIGCPWTVLILVLFIVLVIPAIAGVS